TVRLGGLALAARGCMPLLSTARYRAPSPYLTGLLLLTSGAVACWDAGGPHPVVVGPSGPATDATGSGEGTTSPDGAVPACPAPPAFQPDTEEGAMAPWNALPDLQQGGFDFTW